MLVKYDVFSRHRDGEIESVTYFLNDKFIKYITIKNHWSRSSISLIENDETHKLAENMIKDGIKIEQRYKITNVDNVSYLMSPSETVETPQVPQVVTQSVRTDGIEDELKKLNQTFSYRGDMYIKMDVICEQLRKLNKLLKKHFN